MELTPRALDDPDAVDAADDGSAAGEAAAPRRPRSTLFTRSKCKCALRRPRCVVKPSATMRATPTNSSSDRFL